MSIINEKNQLERLDQLIRLKATGTPKELAAKFDISERTIFRLIDKLKEFGCPVYYDKGRTSFCYECEGKLVIGFKTNGLSKKELNKIIGGFYKKNFALSDFDSKDQYIA